LAKATEILAPQLASDGKLLAQGKVDVRRFTRLNKLEIVAIAYFNQEAKLEENDWLTGFLDDYQNLKMSEEGHERSKLIVEALGRIGGFNEPSPRKPDDRNWIGRNVTARNKDPNKDPNKET
jgi:hypothetical protein